MRLNFKKIKIEGFLSIGSAELELADRGYVLIQGLNNCPEDGAASNGCGKSSLNEALVWCLTGETVRGISKHIPNIHTDTGAKVELEFTADGKDYKLVRSKDHRDLGTNLRIFINGEDKSGKGIRDSEKLLGEYLPELTNSLISSVVVLGQGLPQRFTSNTPAGRKEVLEQLSKSDFMIEDIKRRISTRKGALAEDVRKLDDKILAADSKVAVYRNQQVNCESQLASMADPNELLTQIQSGELKLENLQAELSTLHEQKTQLMETYESLTNQQSILLSEQDRLVQEIRNQYLAQKQELAAQIAQEQATVASLDAEIKRLKNIKDTCPTCGQKLPDVHKVDTATQELECERLLALLQDYRAASKDLTQAEGAEVDQIKSQYKQQLLALSNDVAAIRSNQVNLAGKIQNYEGEKQAQISVVASAKARYESFESTRQNLQQNINLAIEEIKKLEEATVYNKEAREALKARADVISKMNTIASRDFRGILLTSVIEYINKRAKIYSAEIFNSEKTVMTLDGNALNISYDGKLYENLSGGERRKVDLIISFAIRDMLSQYSSFSANILCLDEITDGVDDLGVRSIFNCISSRMQNLESVFIITHKSDIASIPVDSIITVVKDSSGVSSLK